MHGAVLRPLEVAEGVRCHPVGALSELECARHLELLDRCRVTRLAHALLSTLVGRARHVEATGLGRRQLDHQRARARARSMRALGRVARRVGGALGEDEQLGHAAAP